MVVGNMPEAADLVVVGGGPGGYEAALRGAARGRRVMLIDEGGDEGIGGTCLHVGCIPSKALIELAERYHFLGNAQNMGLNVSSASVDLVAFQGWKQSIVDKLTNGVRGALKKGNVAIRRGRARFTGPRSIVVNDREGSPQFIDFKDIVLATGSRPATIGALPVDGERIVDSAGALAISALPASIAVVGGGYIGIELGMAYARLGVTTTIIEATGGLLSSVDSRLVGPVTRRLKALGVRVLTNTRVEGVDDTHVLLEGSDGQLAITAEKVIVATGRRPNTDDIGLEEAGLSTDASGLLSVAPDRRLTAHIAAIGDITPGPALAHKASAESAVAVDALCGDTTAFEPQCIPAVVFSDPEIATVGLTEAEARAAGIETVAMRVPIGASGRAATLSAGLGFSQLVTDKADGSVLGVHLAGPHASELIAEAALAIEMGVTVEDLALTIHPHPTLSEQISDLAKAMSE
jgi:dihydrolipoamide dehydrogenase